MDPDQVDVDTAAPIHAAAHFGSDDALRVLLSAGVDVNTPKRANGFTALHMAAQEGNESTVRSVSQATLLQAPWP